MLKKKLRIRYKTKRKLISSVERSKKEQKIYTQLLEVKHLWDFKYYMLYKPIEKLNELNLSLIEAHLILYKKKLIYPLSNFIDNSISPRLVDSKTIFKESKIGIAEPINGLPIQTKFIEVVFLPLLTFDKSGNRLGYGKGFYDTFLNTCKKTVLKVGLSYFAAEEIITDVYPHDVPLDICVTPESIYFFNDK